VEIPYWIVVRRVGDMSIVGIDFGYFCSPSYVAWLEAKFFILNAYLASIDDPLPGQSQTKDYPSFSFKYRLPHPP